MKGVPTLRHSKRMDTKENNADARPKSFGSFKKKKSRKTAHFSSKTDQGDMMPTRALEKRG